MTRDPIPVIPQPLLARRTTWRRSIIICKYGFVDTLIRGVGAQSGKTPWWALCRNVSVGRIPFRVTSLSVASTSRLPTAARAVSIT